MTIKIIDGFEVFMLPPFHFSNCRDGEDFKVATPWLEDTIPTKQEQSDRDIAVFSLGVVLPRPNDTSVSNYCRVYAGPENVIRHPHYDGEQGYMENHRFRRICTGNADDDMVRAYRAHDLKAHMEVVLQVLYNYSNSGAYQGLPDLVPIITTCAKCGETASSQEFKLVGEEQRCGACRDYCGVSDLWVDRTVYSTNRGTNVDITLMVPIQARLHGQVGYEHDSNDYLVDITHHEGSEYKTPRTAAREIDGVWHSIAELFKDDIGNYHLTYVQACESTSAAESPTCLPF